MSKSTRDERHDQHLIEALNKLPLKMINNEGVYVSIRLIAPRKESGKEHIAKKLHALTKKDIEQIPNTLRNPFIVTPDERKNRKDYYSKVYEAHVHKGFLKIVTEIKADKSEEIVTVFRKRNIK